MGGFVDMITAAIVVDDVQTVNKIPSTRINHSRTVPRLTLDANCLT